MLRPEENEKLTRVGRGTPCGELLRRYWMPVAPASDVATAGSKLRVRVLGEDLVLFRSGDGGLGLIAEQCRHRMASLFYGFVEADGIRCPYHGWKFDCAGSCIEQPFEPADSTLKDEATAVAYPVQELSGLIFAYLGPKPAPLLPRYEPLVRDDVERTVYVLPMLECNWLQVMENSVDPAHTHYLHGYNLTLQGKDDGAFHHRPIAAIDFIEKREANWAGIIKKRVYEGESLNDNEGHPVIFPNILLLPPHPNYMMHFRVPVDDTHTQIYRVRFAPSADGGKVRQNGVPVEHIPPFKDEAGVYHMKSFGSQDGMAWETQGAVTDRSREFLGHTDRGIAMYRRMLRREIDAVAEGKDPAGVVRDPALNEAIGIELSQQQTQFWSERNRSGPQ